MPFSMTPIAYLLIGGAILTGGLWLVDEIGDRREAKVHARYAKAANMTNKEIRAFNSDDEKAGAVLDAIRTKAVETALAVKGEKHPATKEQAAALSAIRWP